MYKINLKNIVWQEGAQYVAWNINTNISSFGDTKEEALDSLSEALDLYLEDKPEVHNINDIDIVSTNFQHA